MSKIADFSFIILFLLSVPLLANGPSADKIVVFGVEEFDEPLLFVDLDEALPIGGALQRVVARKKPEETRWYLRAVCMVPKDDAVDSCEAFQFVEDYAQINGLTKWRRLVSETVYRFSADGTYVAELEEKAKEEIRHSGMTVGSGLGAAMFVGLFHPEYLPLYIAYDLITLPAALFPYEKIQDQIARKKIPELFRVLLTPSEDVILNDEVYSAIRGALTK